MCALDKLRSGKKASSETSDETTVVIKEQVFVLFVCFFGKGLDYLDRNSGNRTQRQIGLKGESSRSCCISGSHRLKRCVDIFQLNLRQSSLITRAFKI